jgi:hypothetical protein
LGNVEEYFKRILNSSRNTDLRLPVGWVTAKPVCRSSIKFKSSKFMKKHGVENELNAQIILI